MMTYVTDWVENIVGKGEKCWLSLKTRIKGESLFKLKITAKMVHFGGFFFFFKSFQNFPSHACGMKAHNCLLKAAVTCCTGIFFSDTTNNSNS